MAVPCILLTVRSRHCVFRIALAGWLFHYIQVNRNNLSQTYEAFRAFLFPENGGLNLPAKVYRPKADKLTTCGSLELLELSAPVIALYRDCFAFYVMEHYIQTIERKFLYWIPS